MKKDEFIRLTTLESWLAKDVGAVRAEFVRWEEFTLYVHRQRSVWEGRETMFPAELRYDVCVGRVQTDNAGSGRLGALFDLLEADRRIMVQCVLNKRLDAWLRRRGYAPYDGSIAYPCNLASPPRYSERD
jgi:hypothetical protein